MKISDLNVMRMAVLQHLRIVYGIKLKSSLNIRDDSNTGIPCHGESSIQVFGVPLENVHACEVTEYGLVPRFLVDACQHLSKYAETEGLFRKSSSVIRLKSLKAKLDQGEECLSTALPCDVASLVKQFFRELPSPIFPAELHQALLQAQQLPSEKERASATQLLSCLLPETNAVTLRFLSCFLNRLSQRATENKMTAYNLSVIFAPNLFPFNTGSKAVEGHDKLEVAVIYTFIENAHNIGVIPDVIVDTVPSLLDAGMLEEMDMDRRRKRRGRLSDAGSASLTSVQRTPSSNARHSSQASKEGYQTRKTRPRERRSFCLGILPRVLFKSGTSESSPLLTENQRPSASKPNRCASVYQKVRSAVKGNISCLSSNKQEEHRTPIPSALPSLNLPIDTPVGITSGNTRKPEAAPRKSSSFSSILKTLCCLSDPGHSEEPELCSSKACDLTQDGGRVVMDSQNNNTPQVNPNGRDEDQARSAPTGPPFATPVFHVDTGASPFKTPTSPTLTFGFNCQARDLIESKYEETVKETTLEGDPKDLVAHGQSNDAPEEDDQKLELLCGAQENTTCGSEPNQDQARACLLEPSAGAAQPVLGIPTDPTPHPGRVAAHVKIFSSLRMRTPKSLRSPLNFQRTPVYKYVKRINSFIERSCMDRGSYRGSSLKPK